MIIKELRITAFGSLENYTISFKDGINVVYGENEKGKSTIESFIKIMLYGFSKIKVNGEAERKRFMPFSGATMKGELILKHDDREYIIKRSFGSTKKEDSTIIIDALTGAEISKNINEYPGKTFLGINAVTFEKTLFVRQLGVTFTKDKEEEIMDRITALFGCGEEEVPVAKALQKLEKIKKELTTSRGIGTLDILKKRESNLLDERYDGYRLAEQNIQWENELFNEKEKRKELNKEIDNLEIYKKYLKKINLQKEYKDISEYLRKSEELKKKEEFIQRELYSANEIIDEVFLDKLKEENRGYLNLLDKINESNHQIQKDKEEYDRLKIEMEQYKFLEVFGDNLKEKLIKVNYEQQIIKEKLTYLERINKDIEQEEKEISKKANGILGLNLFDNARNQIESAFKDYELKLHEIKFIAEKNSIHDNLKSLIKKEKIKRIIGIVLLLLGSGVTFLDMPIKLGAILFLVYGGYLVYTASSNLKELEKLNIANRAIETLNVEIKEIEERLDLYLTKFNFKDYAELLGAVRKYGIYKEYEMGVSIKIEEKRKEVNEGNYLGLKETLAKNSMFLDKIIKYSNCSDINQVVSKIEIYEKKHKQIEDLELEIENKEKNKQMHKENLIFKESEIREKLKTMGLDSLDILDLEVYIKSYKDKLSKYQEIKRNLSSIEETYKVLLKDRDIESIKNELKEIINEENPYTFKSEEEVEVEEKKKSKELIDCEKKIKDLQNNINTRLIGKRDIVSIEEELAEVVDNIKRDSKRVASIDMALNTLNASFNQIRDLVGPEINKRIGENFEKLTSKKYSDVLLAENYQMMVRDKDNIFKGSYLSSGAIDQLYLALRIAIIDLIFKNEECPIILDDALIQYDENRRKEALILIANKLKKQAILFTCQKKEEEILIQKDIKANFIYL